MDALLEEVSYRSEWIGRSYIRMEEFPRKNYVKKFCRWYRLPIWKVNPVTIEKTALDLLIEWLGEEERPAVEQIIALIIEHYGAPGEVWRPAQEDWIEEHLGGRRGRSGFFFVEGLFFAEFGQTVLCFIVGNNE